MFKLKSALLITCIFFISGGFSMPGPGSGPPGPPGGGGPPCWAPPCIPIDSGIGFLLAGGCVFALFRLKKGKDSKR